MLTVEDVKDPQYVNADGTAINCFVKFVGVLEYLPFGATSYDPEPYGVQIYNDCVSGKYGPVAPYNP